MSTFKSILFSAIAIASLSPVAQAQQYTRPFVVRTYCVQVEYEMWRNGSTYWATEFETDDEVDAELMLLALETALDNGYICDILGCGFDWIPRDVRLVVKYDYPEIYALPYNSLVTYYGYGSSLVSEKKLNPAR